MFTKISLSWNGERPLRAHFRLCAGNGIVGYQQSDCTSRGIQSEAEDLGVITGPTGENSASSAGSNMSGPYRTGHVERTYLWPVQAFAAWTESHSAPGLTRSG
jgi:hypothetical protein